MPVFMLFRLGIDKYDISKILPLLGRLNTLPRNYKVNAFGKKNCDIIFNVRTQILCYKYAFYLSHNAVTVSIYFFELKLKMH